MTRVLLLITSLGAGGAQRHVRDLLGGAAPGIEYHLAGGGGGWLRSEAARIGVPVYSLDLSSAVRPMADLRAYRDVLALVRRIAPDLVHVHSTKAAAIGRLAAHAASVPLVYTVHGWPFQGGLDSAGAVLDLLAERLLRREARRVIVVSRRDGAVAERLGLVPRERLEIVENGIDLRQYRWHPGGYERRLEYLGRLERGKGLELLLSVLAGLRNLPWQLTICGTGGLAPLLQRAVRRSALADRVRFAGWVDDPRPVLETSDCLVLPSDKEGLPYSVLEALASGLFVIASAVGGLADIELRQVYRVPRRDAAALRRAIHDYLTAQWRDPNILPRQDETYALFRGGFDLARMVRRVSEIYADALNEHPAPPRPQSG